MKVYLYNTEQEAWDKDAIVCQTIGIGTNPENVTKHYFSPFEYDSQWAYICDETTEPIIGGGWVEIPVE